MILVIGSKGSMGVRYSAILKYLGVPFQGVDIGEKWPQFDKAIVCTPTDTHYEICKHLINEGKPFLCEKPVSKSVAECEQLRDLAQARGLDARMVCNYAFVIGGWILKKDAIPHIDYNNYYTGKDGINWDCIQLHYLSKLPPTITTDRPFFQCTLNYHNITLEDVNKSYIRMLENWISDNQESLWNLHDAVLATEKVLALEGK